MAVQFWGPGVEEVPEIEMYESDPESGDDGYASEVGSVGEADEAVDAGPDPLYPCHGIAGSSVYVDGRCAICRQPSALPAAMDVRRVSAGVQVGAYFILYIFFLFYLLIRYFIL
ncbi:hypothetical protein TSAR_009115 [Trichomalopsis sarcophagae]|uniref:Uncharacterized protein n=1 Tax=Trichomalopsis sarcophagae TaxID=543379 RepID=A0A232EE59_9HYME|nr:hypothetical protein TSAR_009115 [Trichomalopsis sarcophagae]